MNTESYHDHELDCGERPRTELVDITVQGPPKVAGLALMFHLLDSHSMGLLMRARSLSVPCSHCRKLVEQHDEVLPRGAWQALCQALAADVLAIMVGTDVVEELEAEDVEEMRFK